jgi:selenium-binding protein 1
VRKTASIPAEAAAADQLPVLLKGFGAAPPLISDIDLSLDDRFLYVACWGTGELRQYDVSDPMQPKLAGSVRLGGIAQHAPHVTGRPFGGGPQMTEISRDGQRVYFTNSLYSAWDTQFYPEGIPGVMAMCKAGAGGGLELDREFYVDFGAEYGAHQVRLQGGDCSTDSFCYPSA